MRIQCNTSLTFFLTLPPTLPGQKIFATVLTQNFVHKYTKDFPLFIQNVSHGCFPIPVFQEDKCVVKRLDEARAMRFPRVLTHTKVQEPYFLD